MEVRLRFLDEADGVGAKRWSVASESPIIEHALNLHRGQTSRSGSVKSDR